MKFDAHQNRFESKLPKMKIDAIQNIMNRFKASQRNFVIFKRSRLAWEHEEFSHDGKLHFLRALSSFPGCEIIGIWIHHCQTSLESLQLSESPQLYLSNASSFMSQKKLKIQYQ